MAYARHVPHVVHSPYDLLTHLAELPDISKRDESLIHPVQADDIRLLHYRIRAYAGALGSRVDTEEGFTVEPVADEYAEPFEQESAASLCRS